MSLIRAQINAFIVVHLALLVTNVIRAQQKVMFMEVELSNYPIPERPIERTGN
jgi:hypothetical protein